MIRKGCRMDEGFDRTVIVDGKALVYREIIADKEWEFAGRTGRYKVKMNGFVNNRERNSNLSCNCPSWIYKNSNRQRYCKHCKGIMIAELDLQDQFNVIKSHMDNWQEADLF